MMWFRFWDMHSGGNRKLEWENIYIEAKNQVEAEIVFHNRFGRNPNRVTCTCCGEDYSISKYESLEEATGFHRGCHFDIDRERWIDKPSERKNAMYKYAPLPEYSTRKDVLIVPESEISDSEKVGNVPREGYVWVE